MQHDDNGDFSRIDLRALSATQWGALRTEIMRRARSERDKTVRIAIGRAFAWAWRLSRRFQKWSAQHPAWISLIRKRREQIAAAQLRDLDDRWLADMGLTRSEIVRRVRYRLRRVSPPTVEPPRPENDE